MKRTSNTIPAFWRCWWYLCWSPCRVWFALFYRIRVFGRPNRGRRTPGTGILYLANHQSFLDPIIVGIGTRRPFFALARHTLWRSRPLGAIMDSLSAVPVDQDKPDASTMKRCIEILEAGSDLLVFPEGSRTQDGATAAFQSGVMLMIRRANPTVVPVALEGAFDAWPMGGKCRLAGRMAVEVGEPLDTAALLEMKTPAALAFLQGKIEGMRRGLSERIGTPSSPRPAAPPANG